MTYYFVMNKLMKNGVRLSLRDNQCFGNVRLVRGKSTWHLVFSMNFLIRILN